MIKIPKLLISTANPGKLREIEEILSAALAARAQQGSRLAFELILPAQIGLHLDVVEDGSTYIENAERKALAYASASGMPALGDDSGLEVDALGGQPGLYSARYHPLPGASDADRRAYLLQQLRPHPQPWTARFRCAIVLALPGGETCFAEGECRGEIIPGERGSNGFGYDPVFFFPELGKTMAELPQSVKNRISHRARALQAALPLLQKNLGFA
jgi:XTP/dITP diphosphohydrolase